MTIGRSVSASVLSAMVAALVLVTLPLLVPKQTLKGRSRCRLMAEAVDELGCEKIFGVRYCY